MVLIPLIPAIPLLFLQVVPDHQGCRSPFADRAGDLLGTAATDVAGGEHARQAGLHGPAGGDEAPLVGLNDIFDESGIGVQSDEDERGGGK